MELGDLLSPIDLRYALALGLGVSLVGSFIVIPRARVKLLGAGIVGRDIHKPGRPVVPEMGGIAVFLAFNAGVFTVIALGGFDESQKSLILSSLVVAAGACITGVLDDLIELRQRFKAIIPFAFAAPLALFAPDYSITFPLVGNVDFGLLYPLLLVPLGIACASNGFNMLEGFNGLGTGLGIILGVSLSLLAILHGITTGLALLFPLLGALLAFLWFNWVPAKIFPGDTMTLLVGAVLAAGAILSQLEFWGALLFVPHMVEFVLKALSRFDAENFASHVDEKGVLHYHGHVHSLTHIIMKHMRVTEAGLVVRLWAFEGAYCFLVLAAYTLIEGRPVAA